MRLPLKRCVLAIASSTLLISTNARADVTKVTIASRSVVASGQSFGQVGPYEKLSGTIEFAVDPADKHNARAVDLEHATRAADGRGPGLGDPRVIEGPGRMDEGHFTALPFLVPRVDADGNEVAGIRVPELAVPLATTTGWNFRAERVGNPTTLYALLGSYVPFARTKSEREATRDPRLSVEERYRDERDYLQRIRAAADALVKDRFLLQEDVDDVLQRATRHWVYATTPAQGK